MVADADVVAAFPEFAVDTPKIGEGRQKVVYRANAGGSIVALKIMVWSADNPTATEAASEEREEELQEAIERFLREMHGMSAVDCPHVIRVVDGPAVRRIGDSNHYWYTEPFLAGGTLKDRINPGGLPAAEVEEIATGLLIAVQAMSEEGRFVHRDIKPGNIGFREDGTVVIIDLGIALFDEMNPITGSSVTGPGTWQYAAPEQFEIRRLGEIDFRTDLFSVGIVLFEALMGRRPFTGAGATYASNLMSFDASTLNNERASPGLRRLIPRLLAASPSGRYRRVHDALDDLRGGH